MRNLGAKLEWTVDAEKAFIDLKAALARATSLAIPDYQTPFFLDVSERPHAMHGVLFQKKGGSREVLTHVSVILDPIEARQTACSRYAAGLAKILQKTAHIVMCHPLTVLTTHGIMAFITSTAFTLSPVRRNRIEKLLSQPHITYTHEGVNMADAVGDGELHMCEEKAAQELKVRVDLRANPLEEADEILFTDGCCFRHPDEGLKAAMAVVKHDQGEFKEVIKEKLTGQLSAQRAELLAVIAAAEYGKGKRVTIYTDSAYVSNAVHHELAAWLRAGFLTASGTPIKHEKEMKLLAEALLKPAEIAVVKCKGHQTGNTLEARGNQMADKAAKEEAGYSGQFLVKLAKMCADTKLTWVDALPMALMAIRSSVNAVTKFTPFELCTGYQFPGPTASLDLKGDSGERIRYKPYYDQVQCLVSAFSKQVTGGEGEVNQNPPYTAEWVLLKVIKRKWSEPRWTGPSRVTERTSHVVRLEGKGDTWYHWTQCAAAQDPSRN
uniref:uncharacterized protein LOC109962170 n=1 Tax=Monopterus albus TaxID=43700 RepID=UPI0009B3C8FF|nr:uncharacterized protein LOC109962170 [Monopterus albus]